MADLTGSDDYNLQEAWDTVCRSFAKTTMVDLTTKPKYSIDQVLEQIRQKQDDSEQRNIKYKVAKDVISKTLNFIKVLGGIAAQGASMDGLWMRRYWLYEDECVDLVLKWLQDSAVTKKLPEKDMAWVKSLSSKSKPDADLLEHIAKFMAHKWLQTSDWNVAELFYWVDAYSNKIANRKDPNVKQETEDQTEEQRGKKITASRIHEVAEWGRQSLGLDSLGYEETHNVARTLREFRKLDEAVETFQRASSLQEETWLATWGLALVYNLHGKYALAVETLEAVKASIESGKTKDPTAVNSLHKISRDLAWWNKEAGNLEKAWDIYESILQKHPDDYESAFDMTSILYDKGSYAQLVEFLEGLKRSKDEVTGLDRRTRIFHEYYWSDDYHGTIAAAGRSLDGISITTLKDSYRTAIDAAEKKIQLATDQLDREEEKYAREIMAMLMHYCAKFFYNNYTCAEEKEMALSMWVRIIQLDETEMSWYLGRAKLYATRDLSNLYFEKALQAGPGTEPAAKYIDDLEHLATLKSDGNLTDQPKEKYPQQLLARYYGLCGKTEKAKNVIRAFVKTNLDLLSDDDPSNDWQGFKGLAAHFMFAGLTITLWPHGHSSYPIKKMRIRMLAKRPIDWSQLTRQPKSWKVL
ncbi:hypothetical protein N7474_007790 [Penicillium riverlandense]|uniref:uncharacterized protein n=1 Tax=Penicillium riverlandense TaxID=1903569 RepID=UPI00254714E5|nr:uncharacterized protein N7474_007790 [Penicillium riverlandense]KAJ5811489.1 hypothetical protein N7474_007790 [Penicillium riverlandense]